MVIERRILKVFHGLSHHFLQYLVIRSRWRVAGVGHQERQPKHVVDALLLVGGQDLSCTVQLPLGGHRQTHLNGSTEEEMGNRRCSDWNGKPVGFLGFLIRETSRILYNGFQYVSMVFY